MKYLYFCREFEVYIITNTNLNIIEKKNIKILNPKFSYLFKSNFFNSVFCAYLLIKNVYSHSIVFSLDDHLILLVLKKLFFKFKLVLRTSNPIYNPYNKNEASYESYKGFTNKKELFLYRYADLVITFSEKNKKYLKNFFKVKNVEVVYNYFEKSKYKRSPKKIYNVFL